MIVTLLVRMAVRHDHNALRESWLEVGHERSFFYCCWARIAERGLVCVLLPPSEKKVLSVYRKDFHFCYHYYCTQLLSDVLSLLPLFLGLYCSIDDHVFPLFLLGTLRPYIASQHTTSRNLYRG